MKQDIQKELSPGYPWGEYLHYFDTIDSTNTQARQMAKQGAPAGTVLIADRQTGGRGRLGRTFHSPGGVGIYFSVILRPRCHATQLMHLTCAVAVAACDALEKSTGLRPGIKWTNDLVHGKHKLGGILTELGLNSDGTVDYAIIGIGINCCQKPEDFPEEIRSIAASLAMVTGQEIHRPQVAAALMEAMYRLDNTLLTETAATMDRYRADCITLGKDISLVRADGHVRHGTALDIDKEGALVVQLSDGHLETVTSGEVSVRGMYGYL